MSLAAYINPGAVIVIAALVFVYAWAARRSAHGPAPGQKLKFAIAVLVLWAALGPLDAVAIGQRFFLILMVQHFTLAMVVAPLLVVGACDEMLRPWVLSRPLKPVFRYLAKLPIAFVLFTVLFIFLNHAFAIDTACRDAGWRLGLNLLLVVSGLVMWWPLLTPLPEIPKPAYPYRILYLFLLLIPSSAVASPITLSSTVLYSWYAHGLHAMNLTPMEDQVLGGIFMWISLGFYLVGVFSAVFFRWSTEEDASSKASTPSERPRLKVITTPRTTRP